ncbi:glycoside hydrolase family 43 protein [Anditalea andensis]|uniref:Glycoside hydrolase n=1 Tax=Anditalea andensis TaxID=1048983 RepID=A0A074LFU8_9BACT|nr:glycoside hydrolase [Anditalea andensis]
MTFIKPIYLCFLLLILASPCSMSQEGVSKVWKADQGDGTYINPIIHADYSDPDVVRVGGDFYMTASSFNAIPGLPILHSRDLVNWKLVGHALDRQIPGAHFEKPQHGNGVWAPAIRYHKGEYYIYWGDPDFGIYMVKTKDPTGQWEEPVLVEEGKGLIDACPLWDEDGRAYLVHAYAGSRAGIKSILVVKPMNREGTKTTGTGRLVFDGHENHPTVEGAKFYKRNGYYYIFAPAGGVSTGWQLILRSKNPYGPYEEHIALAQGETEINGPHQGGWVSLENGDDWFVHFQDKDAYGRIVHLQPMTWNGDWPTMGEDINGDGTGQPVMRHKKPNVGKTHSIATPPDTDEFDGDALGLQWQWHANPKATWAFVNPAKKQLRLYTYLKPDGNKNLWDVPNLLLQKFPAEEFTATTSLTFHPNEKLENEQVGLLVMGMSYVYLGLESKMDGLYLTHGICQDAENGKPENKRVIKKLNHHSLQLKVEVNEGGLCQFSFSEDGTNFTRVGQSFKAQPGKWIGAKVGLFAVRESQINDSGYADIDWFRITKK